MIRWLSWGTHNFIAACDKVHFERAEDLSGDKDELNRVLTHRNNNQGAVERPLPVSKRYGAPAFRRNELTARRYNQVTTRGDDLRATMSARRRDASASVRFFGYGATFTSTSARPRSVATRPSTPANGSTRTRPDVGTDGSTAGALRATSAG
jgi:hypothetical protein